ncbi:MAG: hypothetical protein CM1200mP30_08750 [Pseudomonadota bacterium]|nr:MAG: hypothetical protein CM1200mP30_08750 [Pseudomonadota bacterium]
MSQQVRKLNQRNYWLKKRIGFFEEKEEEIKRNNNELATEGIVKAEGLNWKQLVIELMRHIIPWKGRLALSFCFGVLRYFHL